MPTENSVYYSSINFIRFRVCGVHCSTVMHLILYLLELPLLFFSHMFCRWDIKVTEVSRIFNFTIQAHSENTQQQKLCILAIDNYIQT